MYLSEHNEYLKYFHGHIHRQVFRLIFQGSYGKALRLFKSFPQAFEFLQSQTAAFYISAKDQDEHSLITTAELLEAFKQALKANYAIQSEQLPETKLEYFKDQAAFTSFDVLLSAWLLEQEKVLHNLESVKQQIYHQLVSRTFSTEDCQDVLGIQLAICSNLCFTKTQLSVSTLETESKNPFKKFYKSLVDKTEHFFHRFKHSLQGLLKKSDPISDDPSLYFQNTQVSQKCVKHFVKQLKRQQKQTMLVDSKNFSFVPCVLNIMGRKLKFCLVSRSGLAYNKGESDEYKISHARMHLSAYRGICDDMPPCKGYRFIYIPHLTQEYNFFLDFILKKLEEHYTSEQLPMLLALEQRRALIGELQTDKACSEKKVFLELLKLKYVFADQLSIKGYANYTYTKEQQAIEEGFYKSCRHCTALKPAVMFSLYQTREVMGQPPTQGLDIEQEALGIGPSITQMKLGL